MPQYNLTVSSPILSNIDSNENVVISVYAVLYAIYDEGDGQSIGLNIDLEPPQDNFVPFESLTEDIVKGWVLNHPKYTEILTSLDMAHDAYLNTTQFSFNI